jgi:hypothetical protein
MAVADLIAFLASDASTCITGSCLNIDVGSTAGIRTLTRRRFFLNLMCLPIYQKAAKPRRRVSRPLETFKSFQGRDPETAQEPGKAVSGLGRARVIHVLFQRKDPARE